MKTLLVGVTVGTIAIGACRPAEADPQEFRLLFANDSTPPVVLRVERPCSYSLVDASVTLLNRDYESLYRIVHACPTGVREMDYPPSTGSFRTAGDSIFFRTGRGESAGEGILRGDTLFIDGPEHRLVLLRVSRGAP
jgi:hypothetical protein